MFNVSTLHIQQKSPPYFLPPSLSLLVVVVFLFVIDTTAATITTINNNGAIENDREAYAHDYKYPHCPSSPSSLHRTFITILSSSSSSFFSFYVSTLFHKHTPPPRVFFLALVLLFPFLLLPSYLHFPPLNFHHASSLSFTHSPHLQPHSLIPHLSPLTSYLLSSHVYPPLYQLTS